MSIPTITFVSALIDLNEDRSKVRTPEKYISLFRKLADSGISICLYVSQEHESLGKELQNEYSNVKLMKITNLEDTETYKIIMQYNPSIPVVSNIEKDTLNYFILMNAKSEFVYNAILSNPFNTEHFAWIDIGICHMISKPEPVLKHIYNFGQSKLQDRLMLFACNWDKEKTLHHMHNISKFVIWRFCGSFFVGDKQSIIEMHNLMLSEIPKFIKNTDINTIVWEVNIWAWLEYKCNWQIDGYIADHNDSILNIPQTYFR